MATKRKRQQNTKSGADCNKCEDFPEEIQTLKNKRMHRAAADGHVTCLKAAIDAGADVNIFDQPTGQRKEILDAIHTFSSGGAYDTSKYAELYFETTDLHDPPQKTALILSAENGHNECVELLIKVGADVNKKDTLGRTPLMAAVESGHHECADLLIQAGADVNEDQINEVQLRQMLDECHYQCFKTREEKAADYDVVYLRLTALMYAAKNGHSSCIELLLKSGAAVNQEDINGCTALRHAETNGHKNCAQLLKNAKTGGTTMGKGKGKKSKKSK